MVPEKIANPRTDQDRAYNAIVELEAKLGRPVSRHEIAEALTERGVIVQSLDGLVWRLEMINHIWVSGRGKFGKHGRLSRLYTATFTIHPEPRRPRPLNPGFAPPPEVRRAIRDLATGLRSLADALGRLDDLVDGPR